MAIVKKRDNNRCWWDCREMGNPHTILIEVENGAATLGNSLALPQKVKHRVTTWSEYTLNLELARFAEWLDMRCEGKRRQKWLSFFLPQQLETSIAAVERIVVRGGLQWSFRRSLRHAWFEMSIGYTKWRCSVGSLVSVWSQGRGADWRCKLVSILLVFKAMERSPKEWVSSTVSKLSDEEILRVALSWEDNVKRSLEEGFISWVNAASKSRPLDLISFSQCWC